MSKYLFLDLGDTDYPQAKKKFLEETGLNCSRGLIAIELKQEIEILTSCLTIPPRAVDLLDVTEKGLVLWILLNENVAAKTIDIVVFIPFSNISSVASDFPYNFDGKIMNLAAWREKYCIAQKETKKKKQKKS